MKTFPKKYKPKDLRNRAEKYREKQKNKLNTDNRNTIFAPTVLDISKKLSYKDFFLLYIKDFFNYNQSTKNNLTHENLFIISNNQFQNICT